MLTPSQEDIMWDQLLALMHTEKSYRVVAIPCHAHENSSRVPLEEWRRKICQWAFRVVDHFRLDREVVAAGMNIFDRFLIEDKSYDESMMDTGACMCPSCKRNVDSRTYQLAAMTAIFVAVKLNAQNEDEPRYSSSFRKHFRLSTFVELSRGQFLEEDICNMERKMLATVRWKVHPPTPVTFLPYILSLMPEREARVPKSYFDLVQHVLRELARYLTELAACLGGSCTYHASSRIAYASILLSMDLMTQQALPLAVRRHFSERVYQVCGMGSHHHNSPIPHLKSILKRALWPEMLLDDNSGENPESSGHPIAIARYYGLLDLSNIYQQQQQGQLQPHGHYATEPLSPNPHGRHQVTPPTSPKPVATKMSSYDEEPSPVAVVSQR